MRIEIVNMVAFKMLEHTNRPTSEYTVVSRMLITKHPVLKDLIGNGYVSSYTLNHDCETFRLRILILSSLPCLCTFLSHNINTVKTASSQFCGYNSLFTRLLTAVAFAIPYTFVFVSFLHCFWPTGWLSPAVKPLNDIRFDNQL